MSAIYWTGKKSYDADRMCHVLQAKIQDRSVAVRISEEAMEDRGEGATRAVAEEKILAALTTDPAKLNAILVTNDDFA